MSEDWLRATVRPAENFRIDTDGPNVARVWNALTGGRDNFEADRRAARQLVAAAPVLAQAAPASRAFLRRTVAYLTADAGIRQFLDIGTGLPTAGSTHVRAMLRSPIGGVTFLDADANDTAAVVGGARAALDFAEPVAIILIDILNFLAQADGIVARLVTVVPPGSYLALTQPAEEEGLANAARRWNRIARTPVFLRDRAAVARWLTGLELVPPGIVELHQWRPAPDDPPVSGVMPLLGAVARKPGG